MSDQSSADRRDLWQATRPQLRDHQWKRLNRLLNAASQGSVLYRRKLGPSPPVLASCDDLRDLPTTTKAELVTTAEAGEWLARSERARVRFHQTSGTSGRPLASPDTAEDWSWWVATWQHTLDAAEIGPGRRALLAFSFGPFVGFWSAFDALVARGVQAIPGGGMSSSARVDLIQRTQANALFCTPSYAMHLAEAARQAGVEPAETTIATVVVAGEPGGSLPTTRQRLAEAWGARIVDHAGATEVGPWGFGDDLWNDPAGLRVVESEFVAEFVSVETGRPAGAGELSRLLLTNLGRVDAPLIRYETGDLVRPEWPEEGPCRFVRLPGGVVGRADDMVVIRGVNVFPSSVEEVMRGIDGVEEWRLIAERPGALDELTVEVEDRSGDTRRVADALRIGLGLRVGVRSAPLGSLPRGEHKSQRFVDRR